MAGIGIVILSSSGCAIAPSSSDSAPIPSSAPQRLIDEDFTDGAFDDVGTGDAGQIWRTFGQGLPGFVGFKPPVGTRSFPLAFVRTPALGGHRWSGAQWLVQSDGAEPQDFCLNKQQDVAVVKFTAFSDIAGQRRMDYGVEVAFLEARSQLAGHPHYGHDLSFEVEQVFNTKNNADQVQLFANVENQAARTYGTIHAHHSGFFSDPSLLQSSYENLVIWRNQPGTGTTNIEQWGGHFQDDYLIPQAMNGLLDPDNPCAYFNIVQISLFRDGVAAQAQLRPGVEPAQAQIGLTHLQAGITSRSDFNLDYAVTIEDFFVLLRGWGQGRKTLLDGDANNDGRVDSQDVDLLRHQFHRGQPQAVTRYAYDRPQDDIQTDAQLRAVVNTSTGEVQLQSDRTLSLLAYQLRSNQAAFRPAAAQPLWDAGLATSTTTELSDGSLPGATGTDWFLGPVYDTNRQSRDLELIWQRDRGSPPRRGRVEFVSDSRSQP
jgi:hypothetical protein